MILVDLERVSARRPDRALFESLSVTVASGDRIGVVGPNGCGKSTLLNLLAGATEPEEGVVRRGRGVRVGLLPQRPALPDGTVRDAVGRHWEAAAVLEHLGMGEMGEAGVATLSGGQAKRVALARVLVDEVDLLVLDEPTNHLDLDAIAWLEERLARFRGGLVLVTHDRHVLDRVTTRMLELDRERHHVHDGGYAGYLDARSRRAEAEATAESVRRNLARAELAWLRRGAPARTRKPKARIAAATAVVEGGPSPADCSGGPLDLAAAGSRGGATPRLGDKVVTLHDVGHRFGDGPWLFAGLDLDLEPGGRLGIVGANGTGKSTLLDILAQRARPTAGRVETGSTVRIGYYDQVGRDLDPTLRVRDVVAGPDGGQPTWDQVKLMERFRFDADAQWAQVATLSGGERRRLQMLVVLTSLPNVLLLDEPTNDLDLDTLRALEDHLEAWPGSLVVVSHDRALLERTVEDVLVLDGKGGAAMAPGGYAGYAAARRGGAAVSGAGKMAGGGAGGPQRPAGAGASVAPAGGAGAGASVAPAGGSGAGASVAPAGGSAAAPGGRHAGERRLRSPSTLRRLLGAAEQELTDAVSARDQLAAELAAPAAGHAHRTEKAHALAAAESRLAEVEERWLALAEELGA